MTLGQLFSVLEKDSHAVIVSKDNVPFVSGSVEEIQSSGQWNLDCQVIHLAAVESKRLFIVLDAEDEA